MGTDTRALPDRAPTQPTPLPKNTTNQPKHSAPNAVGLAVVLCGGRPRLRPTRMLFRAPQAYLAAMALNFVLRYAYMCVCVCGGDEIHTQ